MLEEEFSFLTYTGDTIRVRVARLGMVGLTHEQRVRGDVAAREIRLGVEGGFAPSLHVALRLHEALYGFDPFPPPLLDGTIEAQAFLRRLVEGIRDGFESGRLVVTEGAIPLLGFPPEPELTERNRAPSLEPPLPPIARPAPPERLTFFEVRFVDEVGQPIAGLDVEFNAGARTESTSTNPAGVALLDDVSTMSASVTVVSTEVLGEILEPRWAKVRAGRKPTGINTKTFLFTGSELAGISLKPAVPNTVVLTPALGKLFAELWDKIGHVRHRGTEYSIAGPVSFNGKTDDEGRLLHEDVLPGDYELTLMVDINRLLREPAGVPDVREFKSPLVVLERGDASPEIRLLGSYRSVVMGRVRGMLFDTNKNFILGGAIPDLRKIRLVYEKNNPSELLIVGHTDTTAQPSINDPLSLERAESVRAYLEDDVDAWLARYKDSVPESKRWGDREDLQMIDALPDASTRDSEQEPVRWFQATRMLQVDGKAGEETRRQLILEYMRLDGTTLKDNPDFDINVTTHGCGENFPLDETGEALDQAALDENEDQPDRRVELFFFDREFGIDPPVPGKNSPKGGTEYPEWRKRAQVAEDLRAQEGLSLDIHLHDEEHNLMPRASCEVTVGATQQVLTADDNGVVKITLPANHPDTISLRWGAEGDRERLFAQILFVESNSGSEDQIARARLHNLGYPVLADSDIAVAAFQRDYNLVLEPIDDDQQIPKATRDELAAIWDDRVCDAAFPS